jgi:hypothetical protein
VGEDVGRFWTAYDEGLTSGDRAGAFERSYKALGTSHLDALFDRRIGSASELAETVVRNQTYYESVRAETLSLAAGGTWWAQAQAAFTELERIEPEAVFPPVAFVVGSMSSGGLTSQAGIVVELELFTRQPNSSTTTLTPFELQSARTSANLLPFVVHQLIHVQQTRLGSLRSSEGRTLLERAIFEGIAELATEQLTGQVVGTAAAVYGMAHERPVGDALTFSVRTVHLSLSAQKPSAERNVWRVLVERSVFQGDFTQMNVAWGDQRVTIRGTMEPLPEGSEAWLSVEPKRVVLLEE